MNKRQILASLNKIANELDNTGSYKEATSITGVMKKIAQSMPPELAVMEPKKEEYGDRNKNVVREIMEKIARLLRGNEAAKQYFRGGNLQSLVLAILDVLESEGMQEAISKLNQDLKEFGVSVGSEALGALFNQYLSNKRSKE
jgi:hypothetical protein